MKTTMIGRIWHGWTTHEDADEYEQFFRREVIPDLAAKGDEGYKKIQLLRRAHENEVEFITVMWFDAMEAVKQFAGEDYERAYVPAKVREMLARFDEYSQHYEIREDEDY